MSGNASGGEIADNVKDFEADLGRLEEVVSRLEKGGTTLQESLGLFEEGIRLLQKLQRILELAEMRLEELVEDSEGKLGTRSFKASS